MLILPPLSDFISSQITDLTFHTQNAARLFVEITCLLAQYKCIQASFFF